MKKTLCLVIALIIAFSALPQAVCAADGEPEFLFTLTADGKAEKEVKTGDIITVMFSLSRTDAEEPYTMNAMQNEIRYDSRFFELVQGSELVSSGIRYKDIAMTDSYRAFYMNYLDEKGGTLWQPSVSIGSFQLKVTASQGTAEITNSEYLVSAPDGASSYRAECSNITVTVAGEGKPADKTETGEAAGANGQGVPRALVAIGAAIAGVLAAVFILMLVMTKTVSFNSAGGTAIPSVRLIRGGKISPPINPHKDGAVFAGWYTDKACTQPWNFENDTVRRSITLYAKLR